MMKLPPKANPILSGHSFLPASGDGASLSALSACCVRAAVHFLISG